MLSEAHHATPQIEGRILAIVWCIKMPDNPKIIAFESTQHRFEVPLRPELWSSYATSRGTVLSPQQQPKSPVGRKRNISNDTTGGSRRMKRNRTSHRSLKNKNVAADTSRRMTDYFHSREGVEVPCRPIISGSRSHPPNVRSNSAGGIPNVQFRVPETHVPRLRDLLSSHLGMLSGRPFHAFLEMFDQFDLTLLENTRAIQSSLANIVRAPFRLAEQCRPVIDEIIAAQRSSDPNTVGGPSRRNDGLDEGDTADAYNTSEHAHGHRRARTTSAAYTNDVNREDHIQQTSSSHDRVRPNILSDASDGDDASSIPREPAASGNHAVTAAVNHPHVTSDESPPEAGCAFPNKVGLTERPAGKRMTRKPDRLCSPFKAGVMSRPPPNVDAALNLWTYLCAEDSLLKSTPVIQFGTKSLSGAIVAQSFADSAFVDPIFMNGFVKCVPYDDYYIRPECHGYRLFLDADVSAILKVDLDRRDNSVPKYSESAAIAGIGRCLPFTDFKKAKLILLPVLHMHHWSVYCVNLGQSRIDVLDSQDYSSHGDNSWDSYHSYMGKKIMQRLSDALSKVAPRKFQSFRNWRHVQVNVPVQKSHYDSALFAMKFLEFYDGDGHGSLKADIAPDRSTEQRAEMLYYLTFHSENNVPLPEDILQFRISDHHPFFY